MASPKIGFLHPGDMGISLAAAAQKSGNVACWVSADRSAQTRARAQEHDLLDARTLADLCATCSYIVSICPPHAAEEVAQQVAAHSFQGLYIDANAIAPQRAERIGQILDTVGADFVDGGIIGGPAWRPGGTWLHLAGPKAKEVADCFAGSLLQTNILGSDPGKASALKMCFAANTKGTAALMCAILAAAENIGVREDLLRQWSSGGSDMAERAAEQVRSVTSKAWRFEGEMREISSTFEAAGVPGGFHAAAAVLYGRIAEFKDASSKPSLEKVLAALLQEDA